MDVEAQYKPVLALALPNETLALMSLIRHLAGISILNFAQPAKPWQKLWVFVQVSSHLNHVAVLPVLPGYTISLSPSLVPRWILTTTTKITVATFGSPMTTQITIPRSAHRR